MTNEEINRAIAEKVMGWKFIREFVDTRAYSYSGAIGQSWLYQKPCDTMIQIPRDFNPAENIEQAFEIVHANENNPKLQFGGVKSYTVHHLDEEKYTITWESSFYDGLRTHSATAKSPAMAICLAALEAIGGEGYGLRSRIEVKRLKASLTD